MCELYHVCAVTLPSLAMVGKVICAATEKYRTRDFARGEVC